MHWLLFFAIFRLDANGYMDQVNYLNGTKVFASKIVCDKEAEKLSVPKGYKMISVCLSQAVFKDNSK